MLASRHTKRYPLLWFDENTGENRALRYSRNQKSVFEDEPMEMSHKSLPLQKIDFKVDKQKLQGLMD